MAKEKPKWPFSPIIKEIDERLLSCPFCGSPAYLGFRPTHNEWFTMCASPDCGAYLAKADNKGFQTHAIAIACWNKRAAGGK